MASMWHSKNIGDIKVSSYLIEVDWTLVNSNVSQDVTNAMNEFRACCLTLDTHGVQILIFFASICVI